MSFEPFYTPSILGRRYSRAGARDKRAARASRIYEIIRPCFVFVACAAQERAHARWPARSGRRMRNLSRGTTTAAAES